MKKILFITIFILVAQAAFTSQQRFAQQMTATSAQRTLISFIDKVIQSEYQLYQEGYELYEIKNVQEQGDDLSFDVYFINQQDQELEYIVTIHSKAQQGQPLVTIDQVQQVQPQSVFKSFSSRARGVETTKKRRVTDKVLTDAHFSQEELQNLYQAIKSKNLNFDKNFKFTRKQGQEQVKGQVQNQVTKNDDGWMDNLFVNGTFNSQTVQDIQTIFLDELQLLDDANSLNLDNGYRSYARNNYSEAQYVQEQRKLGLGKKGNRFVNYDDQIQIDQTADNYRQAVSDITNLQLDGQYLNYYSNKNSGYQKNYTNNGSQSDEFMNNNVRSFVLNPTDSKSAEYIKIDQEYGNQTDEQNNQEQYQDESGFYYLSDQGFFVKEKSVYLGKALIDSNNITNDGGEYLTLNVTSLNGEQRQLLKQYFQQLQEISKQSGSNIHQKTIDNRWIKVEFKDLNTQLQRQLVNEANEAVNYSLNLKSKGVYIDHIFNLKIQNLGIIGTNYQFESSFNVNSEGLPQSGQNGWNNEKLGVLITIFHNNQDGTGQIVSLQIKGFNGIENKLE